MARLALLLAAVCACSDALIVQPMRHGGLTFAPAQASTALSRVRMADDPGRKGEQPAPQDEMEGRGANPNDSLYASGADFGAFHPQHPQILLHA